MPFNPDDFQEHHEKLRIIAYSKLRLDFFQPFRDLSKRSQKLVNGEINKYIKELPTENYLELITTDFNNICTDEIFDEDFSKRASTLMVRRSTVNELEQDDEATRAAVKCHEEAMAQCNLKEPAKIISGNT